METKHTPGPWYVSEDAYDTEGYPETAIMIRTLDGRYLIACCISFVEKNGAEIIKANSRLIASAPDLLRELEMAHKIIKNALVVMTTSQKRKWGEINSRQAVDGDGITRANEREFVLKKATGATP